MEALEAINIWVLLLGLLVVVGILSSLIAQRLGAPLLLFFLIIGMLAGEDGPGNIAFSDFGVTYFVGSLALAVILFDGGLRMRLARLRNAATPAIALATIGVIITAGIAGIAAMPILGVSLPEGLLLGSVIASTDAAAVLFLLGAGGLELKRRVGATLELEAGVNDPTAVLLTVLLVQVVVTGGVVSELDIVGFLTSQILLGSVVGVGGGLIIVAALNRLSLQAGLPPLFVVASAVSIFGLAAVAGGSGFLAVYIAGLVVGNRPIRAYPAVLRFHDAATWLAQIIMFLVLGLLVTPSRLLEPAVLVPALAISAALMLLARPAAAAVCLLPFGYSRRETAFVAWVGLRGAVSIFLAAIPVLSSVPNADIYFNVAFVVVLVSLTVQGWTIGPAARLAGVARTDPAPHVNRIEIDLPGRLDLEMVGYPVQAESYAVERGRFPRWLRPLLVLRQGETLSPADAGELEAGDFAYFLAPRNRLRLLDRIFAPMSEPRGDGLFSFRGAVELDGVARLYGAAAPPDLAGKTIADAFAIRYAGAPDVGDRIELGVAALIAAAVTSEGVTLAWLDLEPRSNSPGALAGVAVRRIAAALARPFTRRQPKPSPAPGASEAPEDALRPDEGPSPADALEPSGDPSAAADSSPPPPAEPGAPAADRA